MVKYRQYEYKYVNKHPYFGTRVVGVHRLKIYEKYGENLPACEICGNPVVWNNSHIDHIDDNPLNNIIDNLRPLHPGCNSHRNREYADYNGLAARHKKNTYPNEIMKYGFVNSSQAEKYAKICSEKLRLLYKQRIDIFEEIMINAKIAKESDPDAKQFSAKQKYDNAMVEAGFVRVSGWATPENKEKISAMLETKCGLDSSTGEHLIKKGEKRALKNK